MIMFYVFYAALWLAFWDTVLRTWHLNLFSTASRPLAEATATIPSPEAEAALDLVEDSVLDKAAMHPAAARAMVAERERVVRLKASGCPTLDEEEMLELFARNLAIYEQQERQLRGEQHYHGN